MITLHQGYVSDKDGVSTLATEIDIGDKGREVRLSVDSEYGKFFSPERADYALVGMLAYALRNKHDIICEAPVTDELLYNIQEILIPTFVRSNPRNYHVKIQADVAPPLEKLPIDKTRRGGWYRYLLRRRQLLYRAETSGHKIRVPKFDAPLHFQQRLNQQRLRS
ncbi:MAG: hypothetical protein SR1Q7_04500 [Quinella sp. 1Q7]|nr:hypothetical protein [Quinella sp. 1Q7]